MIRRLLAPLLALAWSFSAFAASGSTSPAPSPPDIATVRAALAGTWQSADDPKFTRELDPDGASADHYEGDSSGTTEGHWMVFFGRTPPPGVAAHGLQPDVIYLRLEQNGDELLFALSGLSRSDLSLIYLARGNALKFMRLK